MLCDWKASVCIWLIRWNRSHPTGSAKQMITCCRPGTTRFACAHTRLSWTWRERNPEVFYGAGPLFASLGFKEFSRHIKTGGEGAWWPSKVGAVQPEARSVNHAQQIIDDAHNAGCRILVYHRHMEDDELAKNHPEWCARDHQGEVLQKRGPKLCFNTPYADFVETRLIELALMGADGFYFDEVHMPKPFCWCDHCQRKFKAQTGMDYPADSDPYDAAFQKAIEFKNVTIEHLFRRWREAIHAVNPDAVLLIGSNSYPQMIERHTTHRLWRIADAMKTEFFLPARASANQVFENDRSIAPTETDARLALGYALARDACDGRPPHVWVHGLPDARHARFATAGLIAHGAVAKLGSQRRHDSRSETLCRRRRFGQPIGSGFRGEAAIALGSGPLQRVGSRSLPARRVTRLEESLVPRLRLVYDAAARIIFPWAWSPTVNWNRGD